MAYCKNCGAEIPEIAKFCPKCGFADPLSALHNASTEPNDRATEQKAVRTEHEEPTVQYNTAPPAQNADNAKYAQQPKPVDFTWFNNRFILLFVITALIAYVLAQLSAVYISLSTGFGIMLAVFAILFAAGALATVIVRCVAAARDSAELRKKYSLRDSICLAIGIIEFLYILAACIAVFILGDRLSGLF